MPRGFLVKRNRKATPVSYRIRAEDEEEHERGRTQRPCDAPPPASASSVPVAPRAHSLSHAPNPVRFGNPETMCQSMYSPTRPVSREHERAALERRFDLGSPVSAESFPNLSGFDAQQHLACAPVDLKIGTSDSNRIASKRAAPEPERKSKPAAKKTKAIRKLQFEDEVTTSPVLGLRIKEGPVEHKPSGVDKPLGEFVCRLCGEAYADPFALAQHRCSRIVRVEYRCPECDKAFSCPANLASHRRWHKPKPPAGATANDGADKKARAPDDATKEAHGELERDRDTPSPGASESGSGSDTDGVYECPRCARKFKRQAYLKKHVLTHHAPTGATHESHAASRDPHVHAPAQAPLDLSACPVCGETFPSRVAQERHVRVQHASHVYPCKHCPAAFYSSPALTRHINKCHPSENRQVILLQVPVRPAC